MYVQRCPECGQRLKTNYCDICMRKVPFGGVKQAERRDPWDSLDGSSSHRREKNHECISFDMQKKAKTTFRSPRKTTAVNKKGASVVAIVLAVLSLLPALFGFVEEAAESVPAPEPQYNVSDGFVEAGDLGAEDVPNVLTGEIYNGNGIRITADTAGLSYGDYTVYMTLYNDTDEKVSINFYQVSLNGCMVPFGLYQDMKPGQSVQTSWSFYEYELEKAGISKVADLTFVMDVYDANTYDDIITGELLTIKTEYDGSEEPRVDASGLELYNDGSVCVILQKAALTDYGECELQLYAQNLSGNTASVFTGSIFINGAQAQGYYSRELRADTHAFETVYIYELEDMGLEALSDIQDITIDLYVDYLDGWDIVESHSESITFEPGAIA